MRTWESVYYQHIKAGDDPAYALYAADEWQLRQGKVMSENHQVPSVGHIVHFVYGDKHVPAIITDSAFVVHDGASTVTTQALTVFPVNEPPFTTVALHDATEAPIGGTWHWPERV